MDESDTKSDICLNRLFFLSPNKRIASDTPYFVIEFLAKSLGVKYNFSNPNWKKSPGSLISTINHVLDEEVTFPIDKIEDILPEIALFVNPNLTEGWTNSSKLIETFWGILNFTPKIPIREEDFFGCKTEKYPNAIDPIMVYHIAYHYKIPCKRDTELESIQREILNYSSKLTPLRKGILERLTSAVMSKNRRGLIYLKSYITDSPTSASSKDFPQRYPKTSAEAIERAAKDYRWDISMSDYPIAEYKELDTVSDDRYSPVDPKWRKIFNLNRKYFHLDFRYIDKYSHLYEDEKIKGIKYRNGGILRNDYLVLGLHPLNPETVDIEDCKTSILSEEIPSDPIERYRRLVSSPDFIVTKDELLELWKSRGSFVSPIDFSKCFTEYHIEMIRVNSLSNEPIRLFIEALIKKNNEILYKSVEKITKNLDVYKDLLFKILDLGLTIRGYNICFDTYPLKESSYDIGKYQDEIEYKTTAKVYSIIESFSQEMLESIPVFTGRNLIDRNTTEFKITLYDDKLKLNEILRRILCPSSIDGCIRTNSNYLLITSWVFLEKITQEPPFNILDLRMIG